MRKRILSLIIGLVILINPINVVANVQIPVKDFKIIRNTHSHITDITIMYCSIFFNCNRLIMNK